VAEGDVMLIPGSRSCLLWPQVDGVPHGAGRDRVPGRLRSAPRGLPGGSLLRAALIRLAPDSLLVFVTALGFVTLLGSLLWIGRPAGSGLAPLWIELSLLPCTAVTFRDCLELCLVTV